MNRRAPLAAWLATGFATAVAMWTAGYLARLPAVNLPPPALLPVLVAVLAAGGALAAWTTGAGPLAGARAGGLAGIVNLLVLGGLLSEGSGAATASAAALWLPGSVALSAAAGAAGGAAVPRRERAPLEPRAWVARFAWVAVAATLLLLAVGGLVTSHGAGLAVPDWPRSYGYNMFLFPLSRMTGGVYYEHAHRLFGALVGLATLVLALLVQRHVPDRALRGAAWGALALVVVQGVLGGLRVVGRWPWFAPEAPPSPKVVLAAVHGVLAHLVLGWLVALAMCLAPRRSEPLAGRTFDRAGSALLVVLLGIQIALGAVQRHLAWGLMAHVAWAAVVAVAAVALGARARGLYGAHRGARWAGHLLAELTVLQLVLGLATLVATGALLESRREGAVAVTLATLHQWCGAWLFAAAVAWAVQLRRAPRV